jgi:hypothetical protein
MGGGGGEKKRSSYKFALITSKEVITWAIWA